MGEALRRDLSNVACSLLELELEYRPRHELVGIFTLGPSPVGEMVGAAAEECRLRFVLSREQDTTVDSEKLMRTRSRSCTGRETSSNKKKGFV